MEIDWVEVLNLDTGKRGRISRAHFNRLPASSVLKEVSADQKPYISEMFKPKKGETVNPETEQADEAEDEDTDA